MCPRYWSTGWLLVGSQSIIVWGRTKFELYFKSSFWQFNDDFHARWISCQSQRPFSKNKKEYFIVHKVVQVVSKAFPLEMLLYEAQFLWIEGMCLCVCVCVFNTFFFKKDKYLLGEFCRGIHKFILKISLYNPVVSCFKQTYMKS